ncbi:chitin synthase activator [Histoplasma capsulatum var. duboisii H88]|uniref:Chitin synthase activator n=1 Tax=Ajellomyces capsulatus (strain H88) TaxID=544711 RepID=F0UAE4_AJEC8|nr:chitin synthase activator [Histoplasma capsulatum var. duboisii H88]QSS49051.1 chitin synthase activator [Histoplasma capsulatum var. duboisii H88]
MPAHHQSPNPHMSATFYPGNVDAFQMPEVISPAPQRVMPEVPENMQDNLAHLEREAYTPGRIASQHAQYDYQQPQPQQQYPNRTSSVPNQGYPQDDRSYSDAYGQEAYGQPLQSLSERPNFSPFPVLRNPPPNVPPTDDQREANLESGRIAVLNSSDPEMQLAWAQDALSYVEVAMQNEIRMAAFQPPRPQTPQIERQLKTDAINVVSFLAEQSHPRALFIKAMWLEFGKFGFRVDKKEAFLCYSQASEKGYARAEYRMGMQFENSGEPLKAIKHYERGVSLGDSASNYRLGMMILLGQHGQRQDYAAGLDHIRYAAQTCDENAPQGAYVYGMLLARELPQVVVPDEYLPYDLNAARINIEKAAYHGFAKAQVKMGAAYELCQLGCDFNPALSLHYNALAARQGEPEAEMAISKWFLCGHEGLFEKNDEMAYTYAKRAAQSGLATAEFALGYFHEIGIYVPVNIKEARVWYAKAAARGNKDASSRIESISRSKTLSRKDHERVAIARIKSQYASHGRAQRFAEPQSVQPIQQDTLEMPDPSRMTISSREPRNHRPMSAAPYPEAPNTGYVNPPGQYSPNMRSSSAFGINPNIRPHSVNPGGPMQAHIPPTGGPVHPQAQGLRPEPGTPKLDIGYSAPPDPSGADRRRRLQRPDHSNHNGSMQSMGPGHGGVSHPDPRGNRLPSSSHPPSGVHYPPRGESKPLKTSSPASSMVRPGQNPSHSASHASQKPAGGLPGKGPKTFEEMGVPQGKGDSDCIVM